MNDKRPNLERAGLFAAITRLFDGPLQIFQFRVVSGHRPNTGYLRLTSGLMFCLSGFHLSSLSLPCGRFFLISTLWETLPCPYPVGDASFAYCGRPIIKTDLKPMSHGANEHSRDKPDLASCGMKYCFHGT